MHSTTALCSPPAMFDMCGAEVVGVEFDLSFYGWHSACQMFASTEFDALALAIVVWCWGPKACFGRRWV